MMDKVSVQAVKQYLLDLGVEVEVDFYTDRLYVVSVTTPLAIQVPKREGGVSLPLGRKILV